MSDEKREKNLDSYDHRWIYAPPPSIEARLKHDATQVPLPTESLSPYPAYDPELHLKRVRQPDRQAHLKRFQIVPRRECSPSVRYPENPDAQPLATTRRDKH